MVMRPKGSAVELEARRRQAVVLLQDGKSNTEVARLVGADLSSVKRWKRAVATGGLTALAAKPNRGRSPKLSPAQRQELANIVRAGPLAAGFRTNLWTCRRVAEVVRQRFGVVYHPDHVGRVLHALGFTQQKPQRRASERDEVAIEQWRKRAWPRTKKKDASGKLPSCSLMKQASCCSR
jgi:transposase